LKEIVEIQIYEKGCLKLVINRDDFEIKEHSPYIFIQYMIRETFSSVRTNKSNIRYAFSLISNESVTFMNQRSKCHFCPSKLLPFVNIYFYLHVGSIAHESRLEK